MAASAMTGARGYHIENNFDKGLLRVLREVYCWEKIQGSGRYACCYCSSVVIGIVVPYSAHDLGTHREHMRVVREHVMRVVREYNEIIDALSPVERRLFAQHLKNLDRRVAPGLQK